MSLVDPFVDDPTKVLFKSMAVLDAARSVVREVPTTLHGNTFTEQLQMNYIRPTFFERIQILIFGVPPHKVLKSRTPTLAETVVASFECDPGSWKQDDAYYVHHSNGIKIWIANDYYGLSMHIAENKKDFRGYNDFSKKERSSIWDAYNTWRDVNNMSSLSIWDKKTRDYARARISIK